jgi:hypothetical protein
MQTLAFLWYELKAAKRHVKEAVAEPQECGKADFSILNSASDSDVSDEGAQHRWRLLLQWRRPGRVRRLRHV